jgi:hypothetical protein
MYLSWGPSNLSVNRHAADAWRHAAGFGNGMAPGAQPCRFRVKHSSGETVCADLDTARALQRQKPGAKIFLERQD